MEFVSYYRYILLGIGVVGGITTTLVLITNVLLGGRHPIATAIVCGLAIPLICFGMAIYCGFNPPHLPPDHPMAGHPDTGVGPFLFTGIFALPISLISSVLAVWLFAPIFRKNVRLR
jgi:hypothetical protein